MTYLGPIWFSLGTGVGLAALGFAWGVIMGMNLREFFPYMVSGYIIWLMWAGFLVGGCRTFLDSSAIMLKNVPMNFMIHPLRLVSGLFIAFIHNSIVFVVAALICRSTELSLAILLVIPGLAATFLIGTVVATINGFINARFNDVEPALTSIMVFIFLTAPIMWVPAAEGRQKLVADVNPMTHLIAIVREPMLGNVPPLLSWVITFVVLFLLSAVASWLIKTKGSRLPFWV